MRKRYIFFAACFMLCINASLFAQTTNPYIEFSPEVLKENKDYNKNFNPSTFNSKILYNCMIDMVNEARKQYSFTDVMKHDIRLDSTAQYQAQYQASKDEKTEIGASPYKTTALRLKKYGLGTNAVELVLKAKATMGDAEYSYYDLCFEWLKPVLKNIKTAKVLLDKQYTYIGFGYETDKYMRSMYASIILGNDLVFNDNRPAPMAKNLPYSKKTSMAPYDDKICQRCNSDISLEQLSDFISVKDNDVILSCPNHKDLKRMIGKEGDAIVLDFVQHRQYECGSANEVDNDRINKGFVTKPITFISMFEANEVTEKKSTRLTAKIATVPEEVDTDNEYDINIFVLKEGKYACRTIIKKKPEAKNAIHKEKINFLKDEKAIQSAGDWVVVKEEHEISFDIPFTADKITYTAEDLAPYIDNLELPPYTVDRIEILAHNSLNYSTDPTQIKNQKSRVESMVKAFSKGHAGVKTDIKYESSWDDFKRDVVYSEDHYDLVLGTPEEAIKRMNANNGKIAKELESYLQKHRYAKVVLHITYNIDGENEQTFALYKFNHAVKNKNLPLAASVQKFIIKQVENKNYPYSVAGSMNIPEDKQHQSLWINKLYTQYLGEATMTDKIAYDMRKVYAWDNTNPIANYNMNVAEVELGTFSSIADVNRIQTAVDRLYTMPVLSKEKVNNLNLELQFKTIDYLITQPSSAEKDVLMTSTLNRIKSSVNPGMASWQNTYKVASLFIKNNDFVYAINLMNPFLKEANLSDDFIFSYISIAAAREDCYMSSQFTNMVKLAAEKNPVRLCGLFDKLPIIIFDNQEVKNTICKSCNR